MQTIPINLLPTLTMKSFEELPNHRDLCRLWKQEPLVRPQPLLELTQDNWVERGAEVMGWSFARLEFWLSSSGWLRAWLRLNLLLSLVLTIAGALLLPPVARVLGQLAESSDRFAVIAKNLFGVLTSLPPVVITLGVLYLTFVLVGRIRRKLSGRRGGYAHEDPYH